MVATLKKNKKQKKTKKKRQLAIDAGSGEWDPEPSVLLRTRAGRFVSVFHFYGTLSVKK